MRSGQEERKTRAIGHTLVVHDPDVRHLTQCSSFDRLLLLLLMKNYQFGAPIFSAAKYCLLKIHFNTPMDEGKSHLFFGSLEVQEKKRQEAGASAVPDFL
jgi:hypothetical protein